MKNRSFRQTMTSYSLYENHFGMMHMGVFTLLLLAQIATMGDIRAQDLSDELKEMEAIGFQQFSDASRVFVRTTDRAKYRVDSSRPGRLVLVIENTRVPLANNRRPLDTSAFDSAVRFIKVNMVEAPSPSVQVVMTLNGKAPFRVSQEDTLITIDFER